MNTTKTKSALRASLALIASRRFGPFLACSFLSNIGTWMQLVAEPWLLLKLGGSSFLVGLDSFMMSGPVLLLIFLGGTLADRRDRRAVILLFQSVQMLCPLALIALILANALTPWMIVALSLVVGITDALSMPAFQSIVPSIVKREEIGHAVALNSADFNLARIVGPALGGFLMAKYGALGCFGANALSYVPFVAAAYLVLPKGAGPRDVAQVPSGLASYAEVWRQPGMRSAFRSVLITSFFCGPLLAFSSVFVKSVLQGDASEFGSCMASFGLGGLAGASLLLFADERADHRKLCSAAATLYGATLVAIAFVHTAAGLRGLMALAGAFMAIANAAANTTLQQSASRHQFGRAAGLYMLFLRGGLALGNLWAGLLVSRSGITSFLIVSGGLGAALQLTNLILWRKNPA